MNNKKRLIITSVISIALVSILFLGSTYSIFTSQEIDEDANVYKTGDLNIKYSSNDIQITSNGPMSVEEAEKIVPHRLTLTNRGNVTYQFDLILTDTTSNTSNTINYQYVMIKVGLLETKRLSECTNNVIKEDIIILPGETVDIDVRIWMADDISNSEINKSFYAKLSVDGLAIYNDNTEIDNSILRVPLYLNQVTPGSYVVYTGDSDNGCDNTNSVNGYTSCSGKNANYVDNDNMGYCMDSNYKFSVNGWRVGYIKDNSTYLVSAGATDCMCTDSSGTADSSGCSSSLSINDLNKHFENMNNIALKYCNSDYAKGGVCDNTTAWAMRGVDFKEITGNDLSPCSNSSNDTLCGYNNDLIDNGGYYLYATPYSASDAFIFNWHPSNKFVSTSYSGDVNGIRPVLALDSSIVVTGGKGTYEEPYVISKSVFAEAEIVVYLNEADIGSYVKYVGNNGCVNTNTVNGYTSCSGKNANYVSDTDKGYCTVDTVKYNFNGWRIGYIVDGSVHLISAGATDCMCTDSSGTAYSSGCSSYLNYANLSKHYNNLDNIALKYCNKDYAKDGICDQTTAWSLDGTDFERMTGRNLSTCYGSYYDVICGYNNDLLDNGGTYWYATFYANSASYSWHPSAFVIYHNNSGDVRGVRPVLALDSLVRIIGGSGTYADPYIIAN